MIALIQWVSFARSGALGERRVGLNVFHGPDAADIVRSAFGAAGPPARQFTNEGVYPCPRR